MIGEFYWVGTTDGKIGCGHKHTREMQARSCYRTFLRDYGLNWCVKANLSVLFTSTRVIIGAGRM